MKLYRQIILLTLALLVLVSSTGMAVGMHICGGELRDVTFFGVEADCPMEQTQKAHPPCHADTQDEDADSKNCCQDHQVVVEQLDLESNHSTISLSTLLGVKFLAVVKAVILRFFALDSALEPAYAHYSSPPIARDIPVLVQSFLL